MNIDLPAPNEGVELIGHEDAERAFRMAMADGALSHGWIISGARGAGKATLAYRIARGILEPDALQDRGSFEMQPTGRCFRLIAQGAHPDLFVAERAWNEKTEKFQSEITVDVIRKLIAFLNRTAALDGYRVAIIDTADDLNKNAANALLKVLEEPPKNTLLLLLAEAPGRLIATIRSRCRRIDLRPVKNNAIVDLLMRHELADRETAMRIADHAGGRPGYALTLAAGDGGEAITLAQRFVEAAKNGNDVSKIAGALTGKAGEAKWAIFKEALVQSLSDAARARARNAELEGPLAGTEASNILSAWEAISSLAGRGEALNVDRGQLISAIAYDMCAALTAR